MNRFGKDFETIFEKNFENSSEAFVDIKPDISQLKIEVIDGNNILTENDIKKEIEDDDNFYENKDLTSNLMSDEIKVEQFELQPYNGNMNDVDFEDFIKPEYLEVRSLQNLVTPKKEPKEYDEIRFDETNEQEKKKNGNKILGDNQETPFACEFCGKYFKNRFNLMYHKRIHSSDEPKRSLDNDSEFPHKKRKLEYKEINGSRIQTHNKLPVQNFSAYNERRFSFDSGLKAIFQEDKKENTSFSCEICDKSFGSKSGYLYHQRSKHNLENDGPTYSCEYCNRIFGNKSHLCYHNKTCLLRLQLSEKGGNVNDNDNKATILKRKIEKTTDIKKQKHHDTLFTLIKSSKMKENLGDSLELKINDNKTESESSQTLREVINIPDVLIKMEPGEQLALNKNNSKQIMPIKTEDSKLKAKEPKPFWLACHDYSKDPDDENDFKVDLIDFLFAKDRLSTKTNNCSKCPKTFPDKRLLLAHSLIHSNEEHITCPYCDGIFFKRDSNYRRHVQQHHSKDYHCKICPKSFSQEVNLMTHERTHSGARPYKCVYCGKGFSQQITMIRHVRIHTGEHPYKCYYCDKAYKQVSNLKCHLQSHHGETNIKTALKLFRECKRNERNHPHEKAKILARNLLQRCAAKKLLNNKLVNLTGNIFAKKPEMHMLNKGKIPLANEM